MRRRRSPKWEPKTEDYVRVLSEQNPWHRDKLVPEAWARTVERPLAAKLWKRLQHGEPRRYEVVLGPRRVGKTTAMYQTLRHLLNQGVSEARLWWLRLDHPLLMQLTLRELVQTAINIGKGTPENPVYLFLDELTYASDWDLWLKTFFDETWPIRLTATSSSTAELKDRRRESGVGRWDEQYLAPYLFPEYLSLINKPIELPSAANLSNCIAETIDRNPLPRTISDTRRRFLLTGGFPELLLNEGGGLSAADEASVLLQSQRTLRNDAVERAIYKDIPQAFGVDNPMLLERMLYTLAGQVAGILSPQNICQSLGGMSKPTFDRYLDYLTQAFLVFTVPNYSGSESAIQKRGRKLYFVDGAVRNAALQRGTAPLSDSEEMGVLLENLVASHLHALSQQSQVRIFYWRDGGDEVDLVYDHPTEPLAFEIASSAHHHRSGLRRFMERFPRFVGRCYVVAPEAPALKPQFSQDKIGCVPLDALLLAIGSQAEMELAQRLELGTAKPA